jgi:nucleoside-diphosphate-sugar epimerase
MLVTGGAGFIGSHVVRWLIERGQRVRVLDNLSSGRREMLGPALDSVELVVGDLCDERVVAQAVAETDAIFHLAAMVSVAESVERPQAAYHTNVIGTVTLLEAARAAGVRRIVQASTCAVYGNTSQLPAREDSRPDPLSPYAATKLAAEQAGRLYTQLYGMQVTALRFFNVYGPRQDPASPYAAAIPRFAEAMRAGRQPTIFGDGLQTRDFVYVGDIVQALWAASQAPGAAGEVLNVGRGAECSVVDLVRTIGELLAIDVDPIFLPAREGEVRRSQADASRLAELTGFRAATDLRTGLALTLAGGAAV